MLHSRADFHGGRGIIDICTGSDGVGGGIEMVLQSERSNETFEMIVSSPPILETGCGIFSSFSVIGFVSSIYVSYRILLIS